MILMGCFSVMIFSCVRCGISYSVIVMMISVDMFSSMVGIVLKLVNSMFVSIMNLLGFSSCWMNCVSVCRKMLKIMLISSSWCRLCFLLLNSYRYSVIEVVIIIMMLFRNISCGLNFVIMFELNVVISSVLFRMNSVLKFMMVGVRMWLVVMVWNSMVEMVMVCVISSRFSSFLL